MSNWTSEEVREITDTLDVLDQGATYRDTRTGWVGRLYKPKDPSKTIQAPDGRPKVGLVGPSGKTDRDDEMRLAFIADLEPVDGPATGFEEG